MRVRLVIYGLVASALMAAMLWPSSAVAQGRQANRTPEDKRVTVTPRTPDGHPDFSGFYGAFISGISQAAPGEKLLTRTQSGSIFFDYGGANLQETMVDHGEDPNQPAYKPEYAARVNEIAATRYGGTSSLDPMMDCKPLGVPRAGIGIMQVLQNAQAMAVMYEAAPGPYFRVIYLDGRPHPQDVDASYMGHSIGHWDGDTLVVDVVGLNDETWLAGGTGSNAMNHTSIHSDQEHVIERWNRDGDTITYQATVEDPVMLTKPWVTRPQRASLAPPDDYIEPQMCVAKDKAHLIKPSETDQFKCDFCVKDPTAVFGDGAGSKK